MIINLLIENYMDKKLINPKIEIPIMISFFTKTFTNSTFEYILSRLNKLSLEQKENYSFLYFFCWLKIPYSNPFIHLQDKKILNVFLKIIFFYYYFFYKLMLEDQNINFKETVSQNINLVSHYALYLVAPYYLPLSVLNYFLKIDQKSLIEEEQFMLAQKNQGLPYSIFLNMVI